eukprot:g82731.t1
MSPATLAVMRKCWRRTRKAEVRDSFVCFEGKVHHGIPEALVAKLKSDPSGSIADYRTARPGFLKMNSNKRA